MGKKKATKMSLTDFLSTQGGESSTSWADEMELPTAPAVDPSRPSGGYGSRGGFSADNDVRPTLDDLPTRAPFTAYMANFPYSASETDIADFFDGCEVISVRIPVDFNTQKPKGFSYIEFKDRETLFKALDFHATYFNGRQVRINVAEQREQDERTNWRRQGNPAHEEQAPKPADTANTWRRAGPPAPIAREDGFGSRAGPRNTEGGERSAPSGQADQVSSWRTGGPRAPSSGSSAFGSRNDNSSAPSSQAAPAPPTERKKLVLQPRSKPTN